MVIDKTIIGLVWALCAALGTNLAFLLEFRGVRAAARVQARHPFRTLYNLFRSPFFAIGWGLAFVTWLFHVFALAMAPLTLVQVVLASGLVFLGIIGERFFHLKMGVQQWIGISLTAIGLALIALTNGPEKHGSYSLAALIAMLGGGFGLGVMLTVRAHSRTLSRRSAGLLLAVASGVLYGVSDVAIKSLSFVLGHGVIALFINPWAGTAILAMIITFYTSARSLQLGPAIAVIALTSVSANLLGIIGGVLVFHDTIGYGALAIIGRVFAFLMVLIGALLVPGPVRLHRASGSRQAWSAGADS